MTLPLGRSRMNDLTCAFARNGNWAGGVARSPSIGVSRPASRVLGRVVSFCFVGWRGWILGVAEAGATRRMVW